LKKIGIKIRRKGYGNTVSGKEKEKECYESK
jgi:hypothetical protein